MNGMYDTNVHTAALIRHNVIAKMPMKTLVTMKVSTTVAADLFLVAGPA
jgi:hypothetical protein